MSVSESRCNNFDLIRLIAAFQVAITHAWHHFGFLENFFISFLNLFPGVPIFFFISGHLIFQAWMRRKSNREFYVNRILRLYPGLWVCTLFTALTLWVCGYLSLSTVNWGAFFPWLISQMTFFQFYNPNFLRGYGVGSVNGSLWSIVVELQFYALVPLLGWGFTVRRRWIAVSVVTLLIVVNAVFSNGRVPGSLAYKIANVSFLPWVYMFIFGALAGRWRVVNDYLAKIPFFVILIAYCVMAILLPGDGNRLGLLEFVLLSALVLRAAYSSPTLTGQLLKGNDLSYGVYLYHMPVINLIIFTNIISGIPAFLLALLASVLLAGASWFFVESPALKLKGRLRDLLAKDASMVPEIKK